MSAPLPATSGLMRPEHKEALVNDAIGCAELEEGGKRLRLLMADGQVIDLLYVRHRVNCWYFTEVAP